MHSSEKIIPLFFLQCLFCLSLTAGTNEFVASISVDVATPLGRISQNIYGQYLEHVQREDECIYPALWDTNSTFRDNSGLRTDVMAVARQLGTPVVRWPGGCFADVYHWRDGVGPQEKRPLRMNKHWGGEEPNHFGTDEFLNWCKQVGCSAYINVNLGTGTLNECLDWLSYCNATNQRVQFWGIGNETFAPWEAGNMDAPTYARTLAKWSAAVRVRDPRVKIMGVGSMSAENPEWDRAVLQAAGQNLDFLTIHAYGYSTGRKDEFEAVAFTPVYFEQRLRKMLRVIDEFAAQRANQEPIGIAMDEWNIRHYQGDQLNRKDPRTLQDAVFVAGVLNSMIRLSPRVAMANYVFLVNGNGVMLVNRDQIVTTPLFHVFQKYRECMTGHALSVTVNCPTTTPPLPQTHTPKHKPPPDFKISPQPWLDVTAALREDGKLSLAIVNRHPTATAKTVLKLPSGFIPSTSWTLSDADVFSANTFIQPDRLKPKLMETSSKPEWVCPPQSVTLLVCEKKLK
ncbi:MAG: alpha-N-arabinofuranosidase [Verrucomicrobiales bacterium]|nr:alpha-N-arabinofuranosidase [Verrucomicrobiales bacterium]